MLLVTFLFKYLLSSAAPIHGASPAGTSSGRSLLQCVCEGWGLELDNS